MMYVLIGVIGALLLLLWAEHETLEQQLEEKDLQIEGQLTLIKKLLNKDDAETEVFRSDFIAEADENERW